MDLSNDPIAPEVEKLMGEIFRAGIKLEGGSQYNKVFGIIHKLQSSLKEKEEVNRGLQNACDSWAVICEELNSKLKEKEKECDGLKGLCILKDAKIDSQKEKLSILSLNCTHYENKAAEKEKECEVWKQSNSHAVELYKKALRREHEWLKQIEELKAENERLKGDVEHYEKEIEALKSNLYSKED